VRAVRFHRHGGPEVLGLEEVAEPEPAPGEICVAVRAVVLNHLDLWVRRGLPLRIEMPHVGGADFAGVVDALGAGVHGFALGERVVGWPALGAEPDGRLPRGPFAILGEQKNGACCEKLALPALNLLHIPDALGFEEAAALPVAFTTAFSMLVERAALRRGETLLVQGASSGVGTAAVQLGKWLGARVIAATRGREKGERLRALGADEVIDPSRERTHLRVHQLTGRAGADVVLSTSGPRAGTRASAPRPSKAASSPAAPPPAASRPRTCPSCSRSASPSTA